jgi:hypothetical protein
MAKETQSKTTKKYYANIEGSEIPWNKDSISVAELRAIGKLPPGLPVVEEYPDGTEKTLTDEDVIVLKPGHRFGRAPKFKRG